MGRRESIRFCLRTNIETLDKGNGNEKIHNHYPVSSGKRVLPWVCVWKFIEHKRGCGG